MSAAVLFGRPPAFSNSTEKLSGLHVILCLFKTVPGRFSLWSPCIYEVTVAYHFLIQAATYAFPPTLASSHPLHSKLPTLALVLLNIMFCLENWEVHFVCLGIHLVYSLIKMILITSTTPPIAVWLSFRLANQCFTSCNGTLWPCYFRSLWTIQKSLGVLLL